MQHFRESLENEERRAQMHGWDFSYLEGRWEDGDSHLPWDFRSVINRIRRPEMQLLDMDTGGGEFLLSLHHPPEHTSAAEGWPPNIALCRERLLPRGIDFRPCPDPKAMPFPDEAFDIITNRHGSYDPAELSRLLRKGGIFVTQQVGGLNDLALRKRLLPDAPNPFADFDLVPQKSRLINNGI